MSASDSRERQFTVGAIGLLTWDQLLQVETYPDAGSYRIVHQVVESSGGTTGNTAVALARLGVDVEIASRIGDDASGQRFVAELQDEGCGVRHVAVQMDAPTDRGVIIVSGEGSQSDRTILWIQGARPKHGDHLPIEQFFARDLVLVDVDDARLRLLLLDLPMHVSPRTRIFGTMTYLVEVEPRQGLELALRHDYLSGNASELCYLTECPSLEDAIKRFQQEMVLSQVRFVAVSDGARGCVMFDREQVIPIPAFEIDVVDPTGAGDAFAAGVGYGILNRWELERTGRFSNAMGALATRQLGARSPLPTRRDVEAFLSNASVRSPDVRSQSHT